VFVNLSIKNAPDRAVQRLRERAARLHRSLQGELPAIIEAAVQEDGPATPADILAEVRRLGLHTLHARLRIEEVAVDREAAISLAIDTGRSAYDASYLWLSRQLGAEPITLDRRLAKAAALG
jgi:antitoxin FitA